MKFAKLLIYTFCCLFFQNCYAVTSVKFTNNTPNTLTTQISAVISDKNYLPGKDWDGKDITLAPYESKTILWFNRMKNVKPKQTYDFQVKISNKNTQEILNYHFRQTGKNILGSSLDLLQKLPDSHEEPILEKDGLEHWETVIENNHYKIHARSWIPLGEVYSSYHLVLEQVQNENPDTTNPEDISVITYNTQLMPFYAGTVDDLNKPQIRVHKIPELLPKVDVIIMEELFDHDLRNTMTVAMQSNYPYQTKVVGDGTSRTLTGGVKIFSRWPIIKENQIIYSSCNGSDCFAAKGAVYAQINKRGKIFNIFGTHLQAWNDPKDENVRITQLQQLKQFVESQFIPKDQPILLGGDFNIDEFGNEVSQLKNILNIDITKNIGYRYSMDTTTNAMAVGNEQSRIDYVFYAKDWQFCEAYNKVFILRDFNAETLWPKFELSDHYPVISEFKCQNYLK